MKHSLTPIVLSFVFATSIAAAQDDHDMHQGHDMENMHQEHGSVDMNGSMDGPGHAANGMGGHMGKPGVPEKVSRTVAITMDDDLRFTPDAITVKAGETIRFFLKNSGNMTHEMVLGSMDALRQHAEMMRSMPDMQHDAPNMARLKPGQRGGIVWQFDEAGTVSFACLVPGHMDAGMVGRITVDK